jgi:hypothetical protein
VHITHWSESRRARNHILLSHLRLTGPEGRGPCMHIPRNRVAQLNHRIPGCPPSLPKTRRGMVEDNPPPHGTSYRSQILMQTGRRAYCEKYEGSVTVYCCLIGDSPNLEGHVLVFISPRNRVVQLHPRAMGSLVVSSYDTQGYGGDTLTRFHTLK